MLGCQGYMLKNGTALIKSVRMQVKDISQQNHITWEPMEPMEPIEPMDQTEPMELMELMESMKPTEPTDIV